MTIAMKKINKMMPKSNWSRGLLRINKKWQLSQKPKDETVLDTQTATGKEFRGRAKLQKGERPFIYSTDISTS